MQDEQEIALCTSCGMCCKGAWFVNIKIAKDELAKVTQTTKLKPYSKRGNLFSPQPCPELSENGCAVYDSRPIDCHDYECKLLKSLKSSNKQLYECLSDVSQLKHKYGQVSELLRAQATSPSIKTFNLRAELGMFLNSIKTKLHSSNDIDEIPTRAQIIQIHDYLKLVNDKFRETKLLAQIIEIMALIWLKKLR